MDKITVDFAKTCGKVNPMHSVNNGPVYKFSSDQRITNIEHYKAAGIPYVRTTPPFSTSTAANISWMSI